MFGWSRKVYLSMAPRTLLQGRVRRALVRTNERSPARAAAYMSSTPRLTPLVYTVMETGVPETLSVAENILENELPCTEEETRSRGEIRDHRRSDGQSHLPHLPCRRVECKL